MSDAPLHDVTAAGPGGIDRLLKPAEAAGLLGVAPQTLAAWRCRREGPAFVKLGRMVRYRASAVAEHIRQLDTPHAPHHPRRPEAAGV